MTKHSEAGGKAYCGSKFVASMLEVVNREAACEFPSVAKFCSVYGHNFFIDTVNWTLLHQQYTLSNLAGVRA